MAVKAGFPKESRLLKRPQFERVLDGGRRVRVERLCTVFFLPNGLDRARLGIIASRKVGCAVKRNRAKRILREIFRRNPQHFKPGQDVVVISGKPLPGLGYQDLERRILTHIARTG